MTSEILNLKISPETFEAQIELIAREFFSCKDMSHASPISYGELVWLMRKLMSVVVAGANPPVQPSEEFLELTGLMKKANTLTDQATCTIEKISSNLQTALQSLETVINQRNAAWSQLEEAGIPITHVT